MRVRQTLSPVSLFPRSHGVAKGSVPTGFTLRLVLSPELVPILARDTVKIVDDFALTNRQLAHQFLRAAHSGAIDIDKSKAATLQTQDGDVRRRSYRKMPHFLVLDFSRG